MPARARGPKPTIQEIQAAFKTCTSTAQVAERLGVTWQTANNYAKRYALKARTPANVEQHMRTIPKLIWGRLANCFPADDLALVFGVPTGVVYRIAEEKGLALYNNHATPFAERMPSRVELMQARYEGQRTNGELAAYYQVSNNVLLRWLDLYAVPRLTPPERAKLTHLRSKVQRMKVQRHKDIAIRNLDEFWATLADAHGYVMGAVVNAE